MNTLRNSLRLVLALATIAVAGAASAESVDYPNPKVGAQPLDLCLDWGVGCGKPAADAWCVSVGFTEATNHVVAPDIGASTPTRLISTGAVCDQAFCDAISQVTCYRPDPVQQVYSNPKVGSDRLDWCAQWGTDCGEPAATLFCQANGWAYAHEFAIAEDIGATHRTRLVTTGAVCDQGYCDGFQTITCRN